MRLDKDKWQKAFENQLDKAEKKQLSKVRRYYKEQYFRGVNSFLSANQTTFQLLFNTSDIIKIYRDLYEDIGLQFAKWYARNFDKYIKKGVNPNQFIDQWSNTFAALGSAVGAERVTLVSGTAKATLVKVTQNLLTDIDFQNSGIDEKTRILRSQFTKYSTFQAQRLVRTEATNAANFATLKSANTIFPAADMMKEWIASFDDRTRSSHAEAGASDPVPQNEPFMVGGSLMMYPGDPNGDAKEVINCRCSIAVFPKETAQATGEITDINFGLGGGTRTGYGLGDFVADIGATVVSGVENISAIAQSSLKSIKEFKDELINKFSQFNIKVNSIRTSRSLSIDDYNKIDGLLGNLFSKYNFGALENQQTVKLSFKSGARTYGFVERYSVSGNLTRINLGDLKRNLDSRIKVIENKFTTRWFSAIDKDKMFLSTPVHEMTHVLLHSSMKSGNQKIALDKIREIRKKYYEEIRSLRNSNNIKKYNDIYIGRYAMHSLDEFIAEAFTEYTLNSNPSKYAKLIGEIIDQYLKK